MMQFDKTNLPAILFIYAGAVAAGLFMSWLNAPLPWMIGPMLFAAMTGLLRFQVRIPKITRPIGQTIVASAVGLSFTPAAVTAVSEQIGAMIAAALLTIVSGFIVAAVLMRLTRIDVISACLSSIPGGPVEMAALASRYGVAPGPVAFAQTLRIALLVLIIPPVLVAISGTSRDAALALAGAQTDYPGALLLVGLAATGGLFFRAVRMTSPFFLGPLGFSATASALSLPVSMTPYWVLAAAQVLLGVWLGRMFDREVLANARGFVPSAMVSTALLLVLCVLVALSISAFTGIEWQTMILATAPGSVTEMALTAKILNQGVALVAAFHIVRVFVIIPSAPLIFAITARLVGITSDDANSSEEQGEKR